MIKPREKLPVDNGTAAQWTNITVASPSEASVTGNVFLPKTQERFTYDDDGNLAQDGRWNYTWDAENRLVAMAPRTLVGPQISLKFEYDSKGRRIRKWVWSNTTWSGSPTTDIKLIYDGWNLIAELNALNTPATLLRSYLWGLDLSGSPQGAGGISGLLAIAYYGSQTTNCFAAFDGNGNVSALVNVADGKALAQYEYGPFGELLRATGPIAKPNPFRFSTKYQDDETDLVWYGHRYEKDGTWLGRDPIAEPGFCLLTTGQEASENHGISDDGEGDTANMNDPITASSPNVYSFIDNDPVNETDPLGLVIIAFYGADYWGSGENGGANPEIRRIAKKVGAAGPYRSLDIWDPYQYLLNYFRNGSGACNTNEPIKIFGHSWGGISAVKLSRWIGRSALRNHETDVYVMDPISKLRLPPTSVPSNVKYFWNRYQTHGGPVLGPIALHGRKLKSYAQQVTRGT